MSRNANNISSIEAHLTERRQAAAQAIDALERQLSPTNLLTQAFGSLKSNGAEMGSNLGAQVKQNPLGLALIGAGIAMIAAPNADQSESDLDREADDEWHAWLNSDEGQSYATLRSTEGKTKRHSSDSSDAYQHRLYRARATSLGIPADHDDTHPDEETSFREKVDAQVARIRAKAQETRDRIDDELSYRRQQLSRGLDKAGTTARKAQEKTRTTAENVNGQIQEIYADNPMAVALGVAAFGALLGGSAPALIRKDNDATRRLAETLEEQTENAVATTRAQAEKAVHSAADKADRQLEESEA